MENRLHIFNLTRDELRDAFSSWGLAPYRAGQVLQWVYERGVADIAQMTNLGKSDRQVLSERLDILRGDIIRHELATDGTQKLLVDWSMQPNVHPAPPARLLPVLGQDDSKQTPNATNQTECVMIPAGDESPQAGELSSGRVSMETNAERTARSRRTACISSQVGCPVGCKFCASGMGGLDGNLTAGQIVQQVWMLQQLSGVGRITNVVFMGMGEPLANFEAVVKAVRTLAADWALGLSRRRITISTVGLPAQIRRLADLEIPATLAISLHAPNDTIRRQIIPWAEFVTIDQLIEAGRYYFDRTGREITLEYILLRNINDRAEHARELAEVARQLRSNINLIRYNEVRDLPYQRPLTDNVLHFQKILRERGVNTHIRASRGRDIAAACGQLRHEHSQSTRA